MFTRIALDAMRANPPMCRQPGSATNPDPRLIIVGSRSPIGPRDPLAGIDDRIVASQEFNVKFQLRHTDILEPAPRGPALDCDSLHFRSSNYFNRRLSRSRFLDSDMRTTFVCVRLQCGPAIFRIASPSISRYFSDSLSIGSLIGNRKLSLTAISTRDLSIFYN